MMSILLLTLLSWLQFQPPLPIPSVSLLPLANVEMSPVHGVVESESKVQFEPDSKSRAKSAASKVLPAPTSAELFVTASVPLGAVPVSTTLKIPFAELIGVELFPALLPPQS